MSATEAAAVNALRPRAWDLLAAAPLIAFYLFVGHAQAPLLWVQLWHGPWTIAAAAAFVAQLLTLAMMIAIAALLLVRRLPLAKAEGIAPRVAAMLASNIQFALLLLPHAVLSPAMALLSAALTTIGLAVAVAALCTLGRSFAILPQARGLASRGLYSLARHPVYAGEMIASAGAMLLFAQPWSASIALAGVALQLWRIGYEEQVLTATHPAYAAYACRTRKLVPGLW